MAYTELRVEFENATVDEVRVAKKCAPTQKGYERLQAMEFFYLGYEIGDVCELCNRSRQTVRRYINLFNRRGIDGLIEKSRAGRPRRIPKGQFQKEVVPLIEDPSRAGESHWTGVKLHGHLTKELCHELGYSTTMRYLHENDFALRYPRTMPAGQDQEKRLSFLSDLRNLLKKRGIQLWFGDESGFEADPRPRRIWVKKGSKPTIPYSGDHIRTSVIGAVQPQSGKLSSIIVPYVDTDVFQIFIDHFAAETKHKNVKVFLVLDNASWHKAATLNWHHITPLFLPPYSPDLNPIEVLWRCLKERFFTNWFTRDPDKLEARLIEGLQDFIQNKKVTASICSINGHIN